MSEFDLSIISSELIRSNLCKTIENLIKSKDYSIEVESASTAGVNNFIGIVYRIRLNKIGDEDKLNSLILKTAPQNTARREQFHSRCCFLREIYMYDEILPTFHSFEMTKGLMKRENSFMEYPKCYQTLDVEPEECLILEDLKVRGFKSIDRHTEELTVDHVRLYLRAIAKYHAISFALRDQQPVKFHELTSNLGDVFIERDNVAIREFFTEQTEYVLKLFSANEYVDLLDKLKRFFVKDALDVAVDGIESEFNDPAAIVSYGDANLNNTLFRYDSEKKPIEICLLDWQASRLSSPVTDIVYFMFACVTKEVRDIHYFSLIKDYHESLSTHIRTLGSDPEQLFSFEMMQDHFQKYAKYGIILAFLVLPVLTSDPDTEVNLDELADNIANGNETYTSLSGRYSEMFDKRMRDVVIDSARLGYI